jgi:TFIIF-interacting CTD phosphatase-like protein
MNRYLSVNKNAKTDKVLVLDLDESLLHTFNEKSELKAGEDLRIMTNPKTMDLRSRVYNLNIETDRGSGNSSVMWGIKRPHLDEFLNFVNDYAMLNIVYTAGIYEYGHSIVDNVFSNSFEPNAILTRNNCEPVGNSYEKPFWKMVKEVPELEGFIKYDGTKGSDNVKNVLIIDDRKVSFRQNPNNGILIPAYDPRTTLESLRQDDQALLQIMNWLRRPEVMNSSDVRKLDKSYIFNKFQPVSMTSGHLVHQKMEVQGKKVVTRT